MSAERRSERQEPMARPEVEDVTRLGSKMAEAPRPLDVAVAGQCQGLGRLALLEWSSLQPRGETE